MEVEGQQGQNNNGNRNNQSQKNHSRGILFVVADEYDEPRSLIHDGVVSFILILYVNLLIVYIVIKRT